MTEHAEIVIVGAGLCGLSAARALHRAGRQVLVIDKSRGVGGRTCIRRDGNAVYDHGGQFARPHTPADHALVNEWLAAGVAVQMPANDPTAPPRYCGKTGMNAIAKYLAADLNLRLDTRPQTIDHDGTSWQLNYDGGTIAADRLIITAPLPQTKALLEPVRSKLPADLYTALDAYTYAPCLAVLAEFEAPTQLPTCGYLAPGGEPIAWISDNAVKGISPVAGTITIHPTPNFSREYYDAPTEDVIALVLEQCRNWLPLPPRRTQLHRWRYAKATGPIDGPPCLRTDTPGTLILAGDAFCRGTVLGACHSGLAAAQELAAAP